jgi:hypothetical protein
MWNKPIPPRPFVLHLNIIARTQYLSDYMQAANTSKESTKFIDGLLGSVAEMSHTPFNESPTVSMATYNELKKSTGSDDEIDALTFILSDVLR